MRFDAWTQTGTAINAVSWPRRPIADDLGKAEVARFPEGGENAIALETSVDVATLNTEFMRRSVEQAAQYPARRSSIDLRQSVGGRHDYRF
jgi:hypothetical protein